MLISTVQIIKLNYLVEDKCLADGAPVSIPGGGEEVEGEDEGETEQDGDGSEEGGDEEHHGGGTDETDQAGVPGEVGEGWSEVWSRSQIQSKTS